MNHKYHVITSLARFENLRVLIGMLEPMGVRWHVIMDSDNPFHISFRKDWIYAYRYSNPGMAFWQRCHLALNWWLDLGLLYTNDRYCFLNDDDAYEPDFFKKVDAHAGELIIASMERGHQTPVGIAAERAHGCGKLEAVPHNMHVGAVGLEQMVASGAILAYPRFPISVSGDGEMIQWMVNNHQAEYAPEASVWFNYYEPGRWNK